MHVFVKSCVCILQFCFLDAVVHHKITPKHDKAGILQKPPEFYQLVKKVEPKVKAKWIMLGCELHMDMDKLNAIQKDNPECLHCLMNMLHQWKNNADPRVPYTWATIIDALRSPIVGEVQLAHELEEWLTTVQAPAAAMPTSSMLLIHVY